MAISLPTLDDEHGPRRPANPGAPGGHGPTGGHRLIGNDFLAASTAGASDERLKAAINSAVMRQHTARKLSIGSLPHPDALRDLAGRIKQHTLDHLDHYLAQLVVNVERNGGHVHFASDGDEARRIIARIAADAGCRRCIKSKSMVSEEIDLVASLEAAGMEVVETDLGEFIVQIDHDRPSHLVAPIVHKSRESIARLFSGYFNVPYNDNPEYLCGLARTYLRRKFRDSDFGMTGGNFLVAEKGLVCSVENEGNQRQSITTPRVFVALVGIEKVIPRMADLAVMLKLLARSATGQPVTIYTNLYGGPRKPGEKDGPQEFHLVLIDNGRTRILQDPARREQLRCIRCGACLNACPVFRKIGGHAYGAVYPGPIGAIITPMFQGLAAYKDLPQASSLCGACAEVCPVKIDIPHQLISLRKQIVDQSLNTRSERAVYRVWAKLLGSPTAYRWMKRMQRWDLSRRADAGGWVRKLPSVLSGWTQVRDMPVPAKTSFHELWDRRPNRAAGPGSASPAGRRDAEVRGNSHE